MFAGFEVIKEEGIEAVIIGSDAVAQHWPLFSTLKLGKHRPFWIEPLQQERRFPNPFWGVGFSDKIPTAMMSVSSQIANTLSLLNPFLSE